MQAKAAKQIASGAASPIATAAAKPATVNLDDNSFVLDIAKAPLPKGKSPCAACGKAVDENAVLCVHCGYNKKTGDKLSVRVLKPQELKGSKAKDGKPYTGASDKGPMVTGLVLIGIFVGLGIAAMNDKDMFVTYWLALRIIGLIVKIGLIKEALDESLVAALLCFFIPFYDLYFVFFKGDNGYLRWAVPSVYLGAIMYVVAAVSQAG